MKQIELKDFLQYRFLSRLTHSPDGKKVAFVATTAHEDGYKYNNNLWVTDLSDKKTTQLTGFGDCGAFFWGKHCIYFIGSRGEKKEGVTQFYALPLEGGEAREAFSIPHKISQVNPIDEDHIAFVATYDHNKAAFDKLTPDQQKEEKDYIIIDELPYWFNGAGYINKTRKVLYTYEISTGTVKQISNKWSDIASLNVQDGNLFYTCATYREKKPQTAELWQYCLKTGVHTKLIGAGKYKVMGGGMLGDKIIAILSDGKPFGVVQNPHVYTIKDGEVELFFRMERSFGSSVGSDCRYGGGSSVEFNKEGLYYITTNSTNSELHVLDKTGKDKTLVADEGSVDMISVHNGKPVYVGMKDQKLQEVYNLEGQLSRVNEEVLKGKCVIKPEHFNIVSDGVTIEGFVMKPRDFDKTKQYPAILNVHGGPHTAYGSVYLHEMQVWANMGYFVLFTNPRGSDGRGDEFADLRGKYGTIDFDDIMRFTDEVLKKHPQINPQKVGITGGSYGGFMTNWAIGHTQRYAAAVSQRSLTNWISMENVADIGYTFDIDQTAGTAWRNMKKVWDQSPLKYANKAKTPTLFIHSEEDYRCPLVEGMQMFQGIKQAGCTAKMVIFKGENHELSRAGKPRHRVRRLTEITNWFEKYLKGVK